MSGIPVSIADSELQCLVIKIMKIIDIEVDDRDIKTCHRIGKSKGNSKKTIVRFCNHKFSKSVLYNKKKLVSVNTSAVGLRNSTKLLMSENLTNYDTKLALKVENSKGIPSFIVPLQGIVLFI